MNRETTLTVAGILIAILGLIIGYLGLFSGPGVLPPPVITGIGFFVIAWVFFAFRKNHGE